MTVVRIRKLLQYAKIQAQAIAKDVFKMSKIMLEALTYKLYLKN